MTSSTNTNRLYLLIGAILVAGTIGSYVVRPAAAQNALSASSGVIGVGQTVVLSQTLDAPATGSVTSFTVQEPDTTMCAANTVGSVPLSRTFPADFHRLSGPSSACDTSQVGQYIASDVVTVGLNSFSFTASFQTNFFVLPESPIGVAALTGSSLAALGAFIGLRKLKSSA